MLSREREWPSSLVAKYYLFQGTATFGFFWPVFTVFLLYRGLSYTQIGTLGSLSAALVVAGEIPTGYVGDRIGRRNSLLVGSVLLTTSVLGFVVARSFAAFVVLWTLWGLGLAFRSGSGDAWLYDTLREHLREERYTRIRGRGGSVNRWASAASMLAAGVLYDVDPRLPFLAGGLLLASSIPVLLSMPEPESDADGDETLTAFEAFSVIRSRLTAPELRSIVAYAALFFAATNAADTFVQPIATRTLALPDTGLGPLYAGFTVAAAVASYYAGALEARLSTHGTALSVGLLVVVFLVLPALVPAAAFATFFVMKSGRAVLQPVVSGYINDRTESVGRATVLSAASMAYALVRLPVKPLIGAVADAWTPILALATLGLGLLVGGGVVRAWDALADEASSGAGRATD